MPAQLSPIALHALSSDVQHSLSELQVHLAVYDHKGWRDDAHQNWFEQPKLGHFFPRRRHRLWTWIGLFYSITLPLIALTGTTAILDREPSTQPWQLWAMIVLLSLACGWVIHKTWRSWTYHREQDLRPTTGLYVLPGVLLLRVPAEPAPRGLVRKEWCIVPIESVREVHCEGESARGLGRPRRVWTCELELTEPADNGLLFFKLWEHPDFTADGPVHRALRSWSERNGEV